MFVFSVGRFSKLVRALIMVIGVLMVSNIYAAQAPPVESHRPLEKVVLQLKWLHQFQFAGYYAAQKEGYFREAGLDVDIRQRDLRKNNIRQVIDGDAQYGVADSILFLYLAKKAPIKIVAPIFQHSPQVFFTLKSSGLDSPYKLGGKRVAFYKQDTDGFATLAMMQQLKVTPLYERIVNKTDPNILVRKEVDVYAGYLTNEAFTLRHEGYDINIINPLNYGIDLYGDMLFTSTKEATEHPDRVKRFKQAVIKGWYYAMSHKKEMVNYILQNYHLKHKSFAHLMHEANALDNIISQQTVPIGTLDAGRVRFINDLMKQHGLITNNIDIEKGLYREVVTDIQLTHSEVAWIKQHPVVRLAIDDNWAPIEYLDSRRNFQGISASFFNYLAAKTGIEFQPDRNSNWVQAVSKMKKNQLDVFSAAVSTADRRKYARFTEAYVKFPMVVATLDTAAYLSDMKFLNNKLIAVTKDYAAEEDMRRVFPHVKLYQVKNAAEGLRAVSTGKVFGYVDNVAVIGHYIKTQGLTNVKISGEMPFSANIAIGVRKDWPELYHIIQKVLSNMSPEEKSKLINPWMQVSYQTQYQWKQLLVYVVPFLVILIIILIFNAKLRSTRAKLEESNQKLSKLSMTDYLTGVYNRQYLDQVLETEKQRVDRYRSNLSVMMVDLDFFKRVNDTHGHLVGDKILVTIAELISSSLRSTDIFGRWGGEEFMVICPETDINQACQLAEKLRQKIEQSTFVEGVQQTLSLGVADYRHPEMIKSTVDRADACLYFAKHHGRNQVAHGKCDSEESHA